MKGFKKDTTIIVIIMSTKSNDDTTPTSGTANERLQGRVKWFNNRAGFGFVTVLSGDKSGEDIFVHHSGIVVESEQYKYLVQGEYVSFTLRSSDNAEHPYQAGEVRGIANGWLMCETRNANKVQRDGEEEGDGSQRRQRRGVNRRRGPRHETGGGGVGNDGWTMNRRGPRSNHSSELEQ